MRGRRRSDAGKSAKANEHLNIPTRQHSWSHRIHRLNAMMKELNAETDRKHRFVVRDLVELRLDWPTHLVDRLPKDFALTLSGPQIETQELKRPAGLAADGLVQFAFAWRDKTRLVELEASGNGQKLMLWRQQVAGDLDTQIDWNERLHPLIGEHHQVEVAGLSTGADRIPADLRGDELDSLLRGII